MNKTKNMPKIIAIMLVATFLLLFPSCAKSAESQELFLKVSEPTDQSIVNKDTVLVKGNTIPEAVVSVNGEVVEVDNEGNFSLAVSLKQGANFIEIITSDAQGDEQSLTLTVFRE